MTSRNRNVQTRSITVGNVFKLVEQVRHDLVKGGYCFLTEQKPGDSDPRDYLYLKSDLSDHVIESSMSQLKEPELMDLQSHHLRAYFQRERFHPKERYSHLYSPSAPKLVVTYEWSMPFSELRGYLNRDNMHKHNWTDHEKGKSHGNEGFFNFFKLMFCLNWCIRSRSSPPEQIEACPMWIDILFNDQNAIDLQVELQQAERIYLYARYHLVIATRSVLTRAWCLFEIMTRLKSEREKVSILHNWSKGPTIFAGVSSVYDSMQASYEGDKTLIQSKIISSFGNKEAFQAAVDKIVEESADDLMHDWCGAIVSSVTAFLACWLVFLIFAPCMIPFLVIGCCIECTHLIREDDGASKMFPTSASLECVIVTSE